MVRHLIFSRSDIFKPQRIASAMSDLMVTTCKTRGRLITKPVAVS